MKLKSNKQKGELKLLMEVMITVIIIYSSELLFMSLLYLILFQAALRQGLVSLLLEGNDDQSNKDVDKEEREDHKVDHIEDGHFYPVAWTWTLVFKGGIHRVLQYTVRRVKQNKVRS